MQVNAIAETNYKKSKGISFSLNCSKTVNYDHFNPNKKPKQLSVLTECIGCNANRELHPEIRKQVEDAIVLKMIPKSHMKFVVFADSGLFQTLVILTKIVQKTTMKTFELTIIDPAFKPICQESNKLREKVQMENRILCLLKWFSSNCICINVFDHVANWCINPNRQVDVLLAIDWLDEYGIIDMTIQKDLFCLKLFLPEMTMLFDFVTVMGNLHLYKAIRSASKFDFKSIDDANKWLDNYVYGNVTEPNDLACDWEQIKIIPQSKSKISKKIIFGVICLSLALGSFSNRFI